MKTKTGYSLRAHYNGPIVRAIKNIFVAVFMVNFITGCNPPDQDNAEYEQAAKTYEVKTDSLPVEEITETVPVNNSQIMKTTITQGVEGSKRVTYSLHEKMVDSLNKIAPVFDPANYNNLAVTYFTSMASKFGGKTFFAESADSIAGSIMEIISTRLEEGTDIVFLIDKTGSMDDDLEKVKETLTLMMNYLSRFKNVKVGMAFYGDKNYHYDFWYNKEDLTSDIESIRSFMETYSTIGNPDTPESVNDAIVKTAEEMNWTEGNKRLMLVIGDAPSQAPPFSDYSARQVVSKCKALNIKFNLYPIIIGSQSSERPAAPIKRDFLKLYPNPAKEYTNIEFDEDGNYIYEIVNIRGQVMTQRETTGKSVRINLDGITNGTYLIQVYDPEYKKYYSSPIIIAH
ncbi:MAG: T9SS type A sorting domain-containing protein [Bacteroidia bacterium]